MSAYGQYMPAGSVPLASHTRFQERALAHTGDGCALPAAAPGCWDWTHYCGKDEFAEPYWLNFDFFDLAAGNLAAGQLRPRIRTLTPDGVFIATGLNGRSSILPLGTACSITIMAEGSGRELMNDYVPLDSIAGDLWSAAAGGGVQPGSWFIPRQFAKQATIRITLRNDSGVAITAGSLTLVGFKVLNRRSLNANIQDCMR